MKRWRLILVVAAMAVGVCAAGGIAAAQEETPEPAAANSATNETLDFGTFQFGSYGRVQVADDGDGHPVRETNAVAHGPRLFEPSYAEIDLGYAMEKADGFGSRVQFTLALFEPFAHYSGDYDQVFAVRNLYAEAWNFVPYVPWLRVWAGSRMYRGDDVYLLDYWPLDNLNTIGGGLIFAWNGLDVRFHGGVNRLNNDYQFQEIEIPGAGFGSREEVLLDRQRTIFSYRAQYERVLYRTFGMKAAAYAETHSLPKGERIPSDLIEDNVPDYDPDTIVADAPEDDGWVAGGELGFFGFGENSHLNLFFRWAQDLAAYGEAGVPYGTTNDGTAEDAYEMVTAASFNWEFRWVGVLAGGYLRKFKDADVNKYDTDDFVEGAFALRPVVFITDHLHQGFEYSYQEHYPFGLDAQTNEHEVAKVTQYSLLEIVGFGRGSYQRPQFRLTYTYAALNDAARRMYAEDDTRRQRTGEHYLGFGVEWWFNSSTY